MRYLLLAAFIISSALAFSPAYNNNNPVSPARSSNSLYTQTDAAAADSTTTPSSVSSSSSIVVEPKEAVKLFGRLAEKYIMLDASAGMCCYSACADCEYRLPGGGYRMADQSAARPKWIPAYTSRCANGKDHTSKWSLELFPSGQAVVTKEEFVQTIQVLDYVPPLGGPYVGASAAAVQDTTAAEELFDVLSNGKTKLSKNRMSVRLKQLANGEEGLTWAGFQNALGL